MKRTGFLTGLFLLTLFSFSQKPGYLAGKVAGFTNQPVYLFSMYGERTTLIDSLVTSADGSFSFQDKNYRHPAMFKLVWNKNMSVELIWGTENVRFRTYVFAPEDSLRIDESLENRIYHDYMRSDRVRQSKLELLAPIIDFYPVRDGYYARTAMEYEDTQRGEEKWLDSLRKAYPGSYAVRILTVYSTPFLPASLTQGDRLNYLKSRSLEKIDFRDTTLLYSNAFTNKAITYLSLYSNSRLNQKQLEGEFIKAVTVILNAAAVSPEVYKFLLDYLVGGFDKFHFDDVLEYMAENFSDPTACEETGNKTNLQKKLDHFKKIAAGKTAPDIEAADTSGKTVRLADIKQDYILVVFWSSECQHCTEMMPKVKQLYDSQKTKKYEIVAFSLDGNPDEWKKFIRDNKLDWINISDLLGFDGKVADDYNLYATPTMVLLDKQKKILAKPVSYRELEQVLRDFKLL